MSAPAGPRNILVTGAADGIGRRLVERLAARGDRVFAAVRRADAVGELGRIPGVVPVLFDITDEAAVRSAADTVAQVTGSSGLHGLVNGAGLIVQGPLELVTTEALRRQFDVNVIGQVTVIRAFLPALRAARGRIVNVGAPTGRTAMPFLGALSASKAALESVTDALRMELRHQGVDVAVVEPGATETGIFAKAARAEAHDLDGPPDVRALYEQATTHASSALAGSPLGPVDQVVDVLITALDARRPDTRYTVGRGARLLVGLRRLPDRLRDRVLLRSLGVRPGDFDLASPAAGAAPTPADELRAAG
jgi:NAD(P)-dependent dehydrogenase (short-subunit alcohol dehydrogenase family)